MGSERNEKLQRRKVRRVIGEDVAINVLELHRFIRRGFFARFRWLLFGR